MNAFCSTIFVTVIHVVSWWKALNRALIVRALRWKFENAKWLIDCHCLIASVCNTQKTRNVLTCWITKLLSNYLRNIAVSFRSKKNRIDGMTRVAFDSSKLRFRTEFCQVFLHFIFFLNKVPIFRINYINAEKRCRTKIRSEVVSFKWLAFWMQNNHSGNPLIFF